VIKLEPCDRPPVANAQPGQWWRYEVASRCNSATGYAPGTKGNARRVAAAALRALERMEGNTRATPRLLKDHDLHSCTCRRCSNERYKIRIYTESLARKAR
jgi:hypothetical protein